tara:strand:- start:541 stop:786 length:246 start_codon:yes stop_codon:yes gene_type:complete
MLYAPAFNDYGQADEVPLWLQTGLETLEKAAAPSVTRLVAENVAAEKEKVRQEMRRYVLVGAVGLGAFMFLTTFIVIAGRK